MLDTAMEEGDTCGAKCKKATKLVRRGALNLSGCRWTAGGARPAPACNGSRQPLCIGRLLLCRLTPAGICTNIVTSSASCAHGAAHRCNLGTTRRSGMCRRSRDFKPFGSRVSFTLRTTTSTYQFASFDG